MQNEISARGYPAKKNRSHAGTQTITLDADDVLEAVAHWLYECYGPMVCDPSFEVKVQEIDDPQPCRQPPIGSPDRKRSGGEEPAQEAMGSPGPSPSKRYLCKDPELMTLERKGVVVRGKQPDTRPIILKRNAKLCQAASCVFSTGQPGQPARAEGRELCIWCDPEAMEAELESPLGRQKIRKALNLFLSLIHI